TTASIDDSVVPTTNEEITLAQTLRQIKAAKPKFVTIVATTATTIRPKDRGVDVQETIPLKRKDHIALNEQIERDIQAKLDAELLEEQKLARKQEEEANIALIESWENTQAMMEADRLLAERLQSKEREELTDEEKAKLLIKNGDEEAVVGEGVVVTSSSLEMLTNSCLGEIMVSLIFLEGLEEEA
ncbi:hypothetical protein Tco_0868713, partial [Tanacetum coccineum]